MVATLRGKSLLKAYFYIICYLLPVSLLIVSALIIIGARAAAAAAAVGGSSKDVMLEVP